MLMMQRQVPFEHPLHDPIRLCTSSRRIFAAIPDDVISRSPPQRTLYSKRFQRVPPKLLTNSRQLYQSPDPSSFPTLCCQVSGSLRHGIHGVDCAFVGLAIMPLQLLELAVIIPRAFYKVFFTRTPRGMYSHWLCMCFRSN